MTREHEDLLMAAVVEPAGTEAEAEAVIVEVGPGSVTFVEYDGRRVTYDATELRAAIGEAAA